MSVFQHVSLKDKSCSIDSATVTPNKINSYMSNSCSDSPSFRNVLVMITSFKSGYKQDPSIMFDFGVFFS